jgi:hypothetical protein
MAFFIHIYVTDFMKGGTELLNLTTTETNNCHTRDPIEQMRNSKEGFEHESKSKIPKRETEIKMGKNTGKCYTDGRTQEDNKQVELWGDRQM